MDAPPTPPPMTTARAWVLKSSLGACLRGHRGRGRRRVSLGEEPVDEAHDDDQGKRELVDRDVGEETRDGDVWQGAQRWVLATDRRVARPQEVDLHRYAPGETKDVDDQSPAAELERCVVLWPALEPGQQDGDVAEDVGQVDHPGRADGDQAGAGVIDERQTRQDTDHDARTDGRVQSRLDSVPDVAEGQLAVARHAERQADGRRLDGKTAHVDRGEDDE